MYPNAHRSTVYNSQDMEATQMSIGRQMDKEVWYMYTMQYYSAIKKKKNAFESVLLRCIKLEPIIQSEVSQKEKHQYRILMHMYGIQKDSYDDPICKTAKEIQMKRTRLLDYVGEDKGGMI